MRQRKTLLDIATGMICAGLVISAGTMVMLVGLYLGKW